MAYQVGDTILDDEYNAFVGSSSDPYGYNHFAGTGAGEYGLNQTSIATVSVGGTINASQWNSLFTGMDNIANHTNTSITASSVSAGDTIAIRAALISDLANLAAAVAGGSTGATALADRAAGTSTNSTTFTGTSTITRSITFANNATMRAYFNAGGTIKCVPGTSGSTDGDKDTVFEQLTAAGDIELKAHSTARLSSGETQTSFASGTGFHDLTTSFTDLLVLTSDNGGDYVNNTLTISARLNAAVGTATIIEIKSVAVDGAGDETFDDPNADGVPANPNLAPAMSLALTAKEPTAAQGLASAIQYLTTAQVTNTP